MKRWIPFILAVVMLGVFAFAGTQALHVSATPGTVSIQSGTGVSVSPGPFPSISCNPAGTGDAGCISGDGTAQNLYGPKFLSTDLGVDGGLIVKLDAGFTGWVTSAGLSTAKVCLTGGICSEPNAPYWQSDSPLLTPSGDPSFVSQGVAYFYNRIKLANAGGTIESHVTGGYIGLQGNCDAAATNCVDVYSSSAVVKSTGYLHQWDNLTNAAAAKMDYTGSLFGGFYTPGFGVGPAGAGRGAFVNNSPTFGSTALTVPDGKVVVIYGSQYGADGGDTCMGNGATGAIDGPHGSVVVGDHYTVDGGWIFEVDNFRKGPNPPSKLWYVGSAGEDGEYGANNRTNWPAWGNSVPYPFGNTLGPTSGQLMHFPVCPHLELDAGIGHFQLIGAFESARAYDFSTDHWYYCDEGDPGDGGYIGYNMFVDTFALSTGFGITDAGIPGNMDVEGTLTVKGSTLPLQAQLTGFFGTNTLSAATVIQDQVFASTAVPVRVSYRIMAAGSDGAHTFTVDVYDNTSSSVLCVTSAQNCNLAVSTVTATCSGSIAAADDIRLRVNTGSCTGTAPQLNEAFEYQ